MEEVLNNDTLDEWNAGEVSTTQNDNMELLDNYDLVDNSSVSDNGSNDEAEIMNYEEIIIETEVDDVNETDDNKYWSYNETSALIKAYASHINKFKDMKRKTQLWEEVCQELAAVNIQKTSESCEKKWRGLFTVYKTHKLNKTGPGKFSFYKEIDDMLKEKAEETDDIEENVIHNKKCKCREKRTLEKQHRHIERMELLKRKLDLEERKVEAFEYYVKRLKHKSS